MHVFGNTLSRCAEVCLHPALLLLCVSCLLQQTFGQDDQHDA
jgi:hypothetical protein